jgi:DNA-binding LacI/PurR family transcriptional regulator
MRHEELFAELQQQLVQGLWKPGDRLPTEREFADRYQVSRPTISKVLGRLRDLGLVTRTVGAGTFVARTEPEAAPAIKTLGLFVPGLGKGEIFEPICARIAELSHEFAFDLTWGSVPAEAEEGDHDARLRQTAQRFIDNRVDGVFFQPIERELGSANKNLAIAAMLEDARIPLVLLDSDYLPYPQRSGHDLVSIDNVQAAWSLCEHLLARGARRVDFLWPPNTAGTFAMRLIGYREALLRAGIEPGRDWEHEGDPSDLEFVQGLLQAGVRDLVCVNDETAALCMRSLDQLGVRVPQDLRIAGFDDVKYARLARVPLTTVRQPCRTLGDVALRTMIERIANPWMAPRTITIATTLCVRESTGLPDRQA